MYKLFALMLASCACNTVANLIWKTYLTEHPFLAMTIKEILCVLLSPNIIVGVILYAFSMIMFLHLLSRYAMSVVVPLAAMTYIFNVFAARFYLNEEISQLQLIGILLIIVGIGLVSKGAHID